MKTILGTEIPRDIKGVVYLCNFDYVNLTITVFKEILFDTSWRALDAYANIPNPPSQIAMGKDYEELIHELELLHKNMKDETWLKELANSL